MSVETDIAAAFADTFATKEIVFGSESTRGFFESSDRIVQTDAGQHMELVTSIKVQTGSISAAREQEVQVSGETWIVDYKQKLGGGYLTEIFLTKPEE